MRREGIEPSTRRLRVTCPAPQPPIDKQLADTQALPPNNRPDSSDSENQIGPDLHALIGAWATLPAVVKTGILAMVKASTGTVE